MKSKKVISRDNLPFNSPLLFMIVMGLLLDRLHAPGWVWGAVGTLCAFMVVMFIVYQFIEIKVDIFKDKL